MNILQRFRRIFGGKPEKNRITAADLQFVRDRVGDPAARRAFTRAIKQMEEETKK